MKVIILLVNIKDVSYLQRGNLFFVAWHTPS